MTTRYRVIKHAPGVPIEVLELNEDITRLEEVMRLLKRIEPWNISAYNTQEAQEFAEMMLQSQRALVHSWLRYAKLRMRKYLAP